MFDIAFSELLVIAIVALLVIGPEKLPKVARTVGALTGRMQRYVAQVKDEINREARFEELQKLQQEIKQTVQNNVVNPLEREAAALQASIHKPSSPAEMKTTKKVVKKPRISAATTAAKPKAEATKPTKVSKTKPTKITTA